jgi:CDP-4-dehydro-6-deoxyglucose reductase
MPVTWYEGQVRQITPIAPNVRSFWVEVPGVERFEFLPGQFVTLDLPIGEKRLQRWRSYSIANAPDGGNVFELCIVRSESGDGTRYLFEAIQPGDTLRFKGPDGGFVLPQAIEQDLVFICTGTGVAPFRSMLQQLRSSGQPHRGLHLIFGTRTADSILYRAEFEALAQEIPNFRYDIVLSREPEWPGWKGHVHQVYLSEYAQPRPDVAFFICGWSNMIDEAVAKLMLELGYQRGQIFYELYG